MSLLAGDSAQRPWFFFDRDRLRALALARRAAYRAERPYPPAVFDGFLGEEIARKLAEGFPGPEHPGWMRRDYREQAARLGQLQRTGFAGVDPGVRHLLAELSGMAFLDFLSSLTGVEGLIADPHFRGAGSRPQDALRRRRRPVVHGPRRRPRGPPLRGRVGRVAESLRGEALHRSGIFPVKISGDRGR